MYSHVVRTLYKVEGILKNDKNTLDLHLSTPRLIIWQIKILLTNMQYVIAG